MPTYDYFCKVCAKEFELSRPMSESQYPAIHMDCGTRCMRVIKAPQVSIPPHHRSDYKGKGGKVDWDGIQRNYAGSAPDDVKKRHS